MLSESVARAERSEGVERENGAGARAKREREEYLSRYRNSKDTLSTILDEQENYRNKKERERRSN
jgi:hypothetical protein